MLGKKNFNIKPVPFYDTIKSSITIDFHKTFIYNIPNCDDEDSSTYFKVIESWDGGNQYEWNICEYHF